MLGKMQIIQGDSGRKQVSEADGQHFGHYLLYTGFCVDFTKNIILDLGRISATHTTLAQPQALAA